MASPTPSSPVRQMFTSIAGRYDLLNRVISLGLDQGWRRALAREVRRSIADDALPPGRLLDLATGTGDVALTLDRRLPPGWRLLGADLTPAMLRVGRGKVALSVAKGGRPIPLLAGDALALPFRDGLFDFVTIAFGVRNLPDRARGFAEMIRVLRPGGRLAVLEFSPEAAPLFAPLFNFYFHNVLPRLGGIISGDRGAYEYLPRSVAAFPTPSALSREMEAAGFTGVRQRPLAMGAVRLHLGQKGS